MLPESVQGNLGLSVPHPELSVMQATGVEFLATFVLVFTIFGVCDEKRTDVKGSPALAIGVAATACCLVAVRKLIEIRILKKICMHFDPSFDTDIFCTQIYFTDQIYRMFNEWSS